MSDYLEIRADDSTALDPTAIVTRCVEGGARALLLDRAALPAEFFDLSSGFTGELLHRLSLYGIRLAAVVANPSRCSRSFQDFVREANRGQQFRFFPTREDAIHWLEAAPPPR